jgi:hypothetical protein
LVKKQETKLSNWTNPESISMVLINQSFAICQSLTRKTPTFAVKNKIL